MPYVAKDDVVKGQIVFGVMIVALLMQRLDQESGILKKNPDYRNLAVEQCTALIDEILAAMPEPARNAVLHRVNVMRERLTKRTYKLHVFNSFLGALDVVCTNYKTRPGTRFDFLVNALRTNGQSLRLVEVSGARPDDEETFKRHFKEAIRNF